MVSILITAWKEEQSIAKCLTSLVAGLEKDVDYELVLGCPDKETYAAALAAMQKAGQQDRLVHVQDEGKGKPRALCKMMDVAKGDIWVFGDGDVWYKEGSVSKLLTHFNNPQVMAVTGRPVSADTKKTMMGYFGNLLADAAHHKRTIDLTDNPQGISTRFVKKRPFFPVSGYLFAMRNTDIRPPHDTLVEDAYISTVIHNRGGRIEYEPAAEVYVKYPTHLSDYFKQKKRSVGGYVQLWQYDIVRPETNTRSFWRELEYAWFPLRYATNTTEMCYSLMLYPIRAWLWMQIFWERRVVKKDFNKTWVRIESTK